jgi:carotenoid cleavage dioxygenase-like enzyme
VDVESLAGCRRPPDDAGSYAARWEGARPAWLRGSVVRTCPAVFRLPGWQSAHLFDGLGALFAWRLQDQPRLDWRLLDCEASRDARRGRARLATFGTRMRRPWWLRLFQPVPRISDNVNVNVQPFAGGLVAMTEAPKQALIDAGNLAVKGWLHYDDPLGAVAMTAHPVLDHEAGLVLNMAQVFGARPECVLYQHAPNDLRRRVLARWRASEMPYLHSFGLTPRRAVLISHPLLMRPRTMLWSERPYIEHFRWQPARGTRLVVLDRAGGEPRVVETDACFVFHVANAYEERDATVVDALAYPDPGVVGELRAENLANAPTAKPDYVRIRIPASGRATLERRLERRFDFPVIHPRAAGRAHRYCWGADPWSGQGSSTLYKLDVQTGTVGAARLDGWIAGEPLFVAEPGAAAEDAGVLLAAGSHLTRKAAALFVLDATSMDVLAAAEAPVNVPLGFHGTFIH